jgi:tetratricopeptide (TPR) repeat protein
MRNFLPRALCRLVVTIAAALALYRFAWMPEHADHVLKEVTVSTQTALKMDSERAVLIARDNLDRLKPIAGACSLSVDYHMIYAVNARLLARNDEAIEHYSTALAADQRPEIYFERGLTYLEEGKLDAATADLGLAARFNPYSLEQLDPDMQEHVRAFIKTVPYNPPPR